MMRFTFVAAVVVAVYVRYSSGDDSPTFVDFPFGDSGLPLDLPNFPFGDDAPFGEGFPFGDSGLPLDLPNMTSLLGGANASKLVMTATDMGDMESDDMDDIIEDTDDLIEEMDDMDDDEEEDSDGPAINISGNSGVLDVENDGQGGITIGGKPLNISSGSSVYIDNSANGTYTITSQAGIDCVKACGSMFIDDNFFKGTNKDYAPCTSKCYQTYGVKQ